ncbi:MAG: hypothetical protein JWO82_2504 [Akkermansiaceae bacterium]|nr:hypothetical protein [Akkermansiaceae bacterium]
MSKPTKPALKLKLKMRQIKALQEKHKIANLLQPDTKEIASADALVDIYFEGSRHWPEPPSMEAIEEMDFHELIDALKAMYSDAPGAEGNG